MSDSEEQMNVVHLDIVINIAYGKFSMKVYDIIVEGQGSIPGTIAKIGRKVLGMSRSFETTAAKNIFDNTVQELADKMYRIQSSLGRVPTELDINKVLKDTLYTEDSAKVFANPKSPDYLTPNQIKELRQDAIDAAKKIAEKRLKDNNVASSTKSGVVSKVAKKLDLTTMSGVLNRLYQVGIFSAAAFVDGGPIHDYFARKSMANHKLELGPNAADPKYPDYFDGKGITQEQYHKYLAEEKFVMITNLAPYMIPFTGLIGKVTMGGIIGTNMDYSGPNSNAKDVAVATGTGALVGAGVSGAGWIISKLTPKGWNVANKALAAAWIGYLTTDPKVPFTGRIFNKSEDLTLRQTLTTLALAEEMEFVPNVVSKIETGLDKIQEDATKYVMDWAKKKGIPFTGGPPAPAPIPQQVPANGPAVKPANKNAIPANLPDNPTVFHPNEWIQKGGSWQYLGRSKHTLTNYDFNQLKDGDPVPLD